MIRALFVSIALVSASFVSQAHAQARPCATVFQYENFGGERFTFADSAQSPNLERVAFQRNANENWHNRTSSAFVSQGCTLVLFQYTNFQGRVISLAGAPTGYGSFDDLADYSFNNLASSAICSCAN